VPLASSATDSSVPVLYQAFIETLPPPLQPVARELPSRLQLARPGAGSFREAFPHELMLTVPQWFAQALPKTDPGVVRNATLAHLLGVLEMTVVERAAREQLASDRELAALLEQLSMARSRTYAGLGRGAQRAYEIARAETLSALAEERALLPDARPVTLSDYRRVTRAKDAVFVCSTLLLAQAAGAAPREIRIIDRALHSMGAGMRLEHDVLGWERDWRSGAAWAVSLARGLASRRRAREQATEPDLLRRAVLGSGVLQVLLGSAVREFRAARRRSWMLGAARISAWAGAREQQLAELLLRESESAGYAVRWQTLAPWAREVFR
jgi:hypothetical protein